MKIRSDWYEVISNQIKQEYYHKLIDFLKDEYKSFNIYPPKEQIFRAFTLTSCENTKVVIIGQDPYHTEGVANGLAFSVNKNQKLPPSLQNIFKEIQLEYGSCPPNGDLESWAKQGVLMLNSVLTVRQAQPNSHKDRGWEVFTDSIISYLNQKNTPVVFMLWGSYAQKKGNLITNPNHLVLKAPHPSPLSASRGFFGCNHFRLANEFLTKNGLKPIKWD